MSEMKRAQLLPIVPPKDPEATSKGPRRTIRITVALPESTEDTCPEYNYKDEVAAAKKRLKIKVPGEVANGANNNIHMDPLNNPEDDDDDVRRIAREMEAKYGTGTSMPTKKRRKDRKDDYADIGMGYDESDSFIDNTDGYDEIIPQNVTTLHGGFYINSGALEFKTDDEANSDYSSSSSSEDEGSTKKTSNRKRIIESSDETDTENKTDVDDNSKTNNLAKKIKLQNGGTNGVQPSLKKKLLAQNQVYIKKRRLIDPEKKLVKDILREKRQDLNMSVPSELQLTPVKPDIGDSNQCQKDNSAPKKTLVFPATKVVEKNVVDSIESVVKGSLKKSTTNTPPPQPTPPPPPPQMEEITAKIIINSSDESSHDTAPTTNGNIARSPIVENKLPENLPVAITSVITSIRTAAMQPNFMSSASEINLLLLRLEDKCKHVGRTSRTKIYEHLAAYMKCSGDSLSKQAKQLKIEDNKKKLKVLLKWLKTEINSIMPGLLEGHEKESQKILQRKFSHESIDNEENKALRMPKRRFKWNDRSKKHLKEIITFKRSNLLGEGLTHETVDEIMNKFLKNDILMLWPDGWMSMNQLNKIYTTYSDLARSHNTSNTPSPSTAKTVSSSLTILPVVPEKNLQDRIHSFSSELSITKTTTEIPSQSSSDVANNNSNKKQSSSSHSEPKKQSSSSHLDPKKPSSSHSEPSSSKSNKIKVKPQSELLKSSHIKDDDVMIIETPVAPSSSKISERISPPSIINITTDIPTNNNNVNAKSDDSYCQVIDLSDKTDLSKLKSEKHKFSVSDLVKENKPAHKISKNHELSITPAYPPPSKSTSSSSKVPPSNAGDDIMKVMEDLKFLQKMSSPKKSDSSGGGGGSSAVSVIAVNKSFAPKSGSQSNHASSTVSHNKYDYNEFQKQFINTLSQLGSSTTTASSGSFNNSIDRYPHIASGASTVTSNDKYYQNSNNSFPQGSNGHKSSISQSGGTYNILDDMFANLFTQYGYSKEAPKSQQK